MNDDKDFCPVSDSGKHRYFIAKTAEVFVPYKENKNLYEKKVLVVSGCNCGSALSEVVEVKYANH